MSFDAILELLGGIGQFQAFLLIAFSFAKFSVACAMSLLVFLDFEREFTCETRTGSKLNSDEFCTLKGSSEKLCQKITFDMTIRTSTIQSQFELICDKEYLSTLTSSLFFVGLLIGGIVYGILSDNFGRMKMLSLAGVHCLVTGLGVPFLPSIELYSIGRLLHGIGVAGILIINNSAFSEYIPSNKRLNAHILYNSAFGIGCVIFVGFAYVFSDHLQLQLFINVLILPVISYYFILPESPRWLLSKNRLDDAFLMTAKIAKWNKKQITKDLFNFKLNDYNVDATICTCTDIDIDFDSQIVTEVEEESSETTQRNNSSVFKTLKGNLSLVWENKIFLFVSIIMWFVFLSLCLSELLLILSSDKIGSDVYINLIFMGVVEIFGCFAVILIGKFFNRRPLLTGGLCMSTLLNIILSALFKRTGYEILASIVAPISKFFIGSLINFMYVYSFEIFPTEVRSSLMGGMTVSGSIGFIILPFIKKLYKFWEPLPFLISSILLIISAILSIFLPETKNQKTPETLEDGIKLVETNEIWKPKEESESNKISDIFIFNNSTC